MEALLLSLFVILILLSPVLIGFGIGWAVRGRRIKSSPAFDAGKWITQQVAQYPLVDILSPAQRSEIERYYSTSWSEKVSAPVVAADTAVAERAAPVTAVVTAAIPTVQPASRHVAHSAPAKPAATVIVAPPLPRTARVPAGARTSTAELPKAHASAHPARPKAHATTPARQHMAAGPASALPDQPGHNRPDDVPPTRKPRAPRAPIVWDPAVLLLYLGAFLVVSAGLVYASYSWADLQAWQKLGMLMVMTAAFAVGGWLLLGIPRVRQAAETFVVIGALLMPANAIAAYTVLEQTEARTSLIVLLGAIATALLHGVFSVRPGGVIYAYGTAIASTLAIGALLPALGTGVAWAAVPVLLAAAVGPDLAFHSRHRLSHLELPLTLVLMAAIVPAYGVGMLDLPNTPAPWSFAVTNAAATLALARLALRLSSEFAPIPAILSSVTAALGAVTALNALGVDAPAIWIFTAAAAVMLLNGTYSFRPDGDAYSYLAAMAGAVAIGSVLPALGAGVAWGMVALLLVAAVAPDLVWRTPPQFAHLRFPIAVVLSSAILPAYLLGIGDGIAAATSWPLVAVNVAATLALARLAIRLPHDLPGVAAVATLVAAVVLSLIDLGVESVPVMVFASAGAATVLSGVFSFRPGSPVFIYGTTTAAVLAAGALPPALGTDIAWGGVAVLLAAAAGPDLAPRLGARLSHLRLPLVTSLLVAIPIAYAAGIADIVETSSLWALVALNLAATLALARAATWLPHQVPAMLASFTMVATVAATLVKLGVDDIAVHVLLAAVAVTLLNTGFSFRPGGIIFGYVASVAATIAIGAFPPAVGTGLAWGAVPVLLTAALVPDLVERSPSWLSHLRWPLTLVTSLAILPAYAGGMADALDAERLWAIVAINAAATLALAQVARRTSLELPASLGSVTLIATLVSTLWAADVTNDTVWVLAIIGMAFGLVALGELVVPFKRLPLTRLVLHVEAVAGFALASLGGLIEADWLAATALGSGVAGASLIAWIRAERWWLPVAAAFFTGYWYALPGFDTVADWAPETRLQYGIPLPLVIGAAALALGRWTAWHRLPESERWDIPVWIPAGLTAGAITLQPFLTEEAIGTEMLRTIALGSTLFALGALVAARSLERYPLVRLAYGAWAALAILTLTSSLAGHQADQALVAMVLTVPVVLLSLPGVPLFRGPLHRLEPFWRDRDRPAAGPEVYPLGIVGAGSVAMIFGYTASYVLSRDESLTFDLPGIRWTWILYLVTWATFTVGTVLAGEWLDRRRPDPDRLRMMSAATLALGAVTTLLLLRMLTTDLILWTSAGIGVALALHLGASLAEGRVDHRLFRTYLRADADAVSMWLGAGAVAANLALAIRTPDAAREWVQLLTYGLAALVLLGLAAWSEDRFRLHAGLRLASVAVVYSARMISDEPGAMPLSLVALAWLVMGTSLALPGALRWAGQPGQGSAVLTGALAFAVALWINEPVDIASSNWSVLISTLVSLAGLLVVHAWLRRDRLEGIAASLVAMAALMLQIQRGEPSNIQLYTAPVAIYLLALGVVQRRNAPVRDVLLGIGSGLLLVPPLLQAQLGGDFTQLLIASVAALLLFVSGALLRLRVTIAAGVLGVSVITLRMLVDVVNALPSWITLLAGGLLLLTIGTVLTIWKVETRDRLERMQANWHQMG